MKLNTNLKISQINGNLAVDDRGAIRFVNEFDFRNIKRFYQVENIDTSIIRAFHGHLKEGKYIYVASGSIIFCAVLLDNVKNPSKKTIVKRLVLSEKKPQIIFIPPGYANGFRALEKDTIIFFFSTSTLEESKNDDYRFPFDYWGKEIWEIENR